uniref:Uncharacterized protein n=1 Tax=Periophthalmus magnuspinnatus TaxID=409849 RepID=A0A3B3ZF48_9GOBI
MIFLYDLAFSLFLHTYISDGRQEAVCFDKITSRIQKLCYGLNADFVDPRNGSLTPPLHCSMLAPTSLSSPGKYCASIALFKMNNKHFLIFF